MSEHAAVRDAWTEIAPAYDEHVTPVNVTIAETALELAGLRPGMHFLDVAAGSGALSIPAARAGASVLATDISPAMIERLERRARDEGLADLEARVMDGQDLDLPDDAFDVAGSQFGVMLFTDLPRGLAELVRVTKPGGRVLLVTLGPPERVEFLTVFLDAVRAAVPDFEGLPMDPPPLPFQLADPDGLHDAMADAGLSELAVETTTHELAFGSGSAMWEWVTASNPIGAELVADLTAAQRTAVLAALDDRLRERADGGGPAVLHNAANVAIGTK